MIIEYEYLTDDDYMLRAALSLGHNVYVTAARTAGSMFSKITAGKCMLL